MLPSKSEKSHAAFFMHKNEAHGKKAPDAALLIYY